jgi:hypothetical protein
MGNEELPRSEVGDALEDDPAAPMFEDWPVNDKLMALEYELSLE